MKFQGWAGVAAGMLFGLVGPVAGQGPKPGSAGSRDFYGDIAGVKLLRPDDRVDMPRVPAPAGAKVLFDGTNLDQWTRADGKGAAPWSILPGGVAQVSATGQTNLRTKETFAGHFRLHVEFRVPYMPDQTGQGRGNSGVYLQGRYEVQILDSYGLVSQDNDCGGIYKVAVPRVNACKAPTVWQTYDIDFHAPQFDPNGKKTAPARISVKQNGVEIHRDVPILLDNTVAGMGGDPKEPGPIMLQDHGNPVQYRNIWLQPLP